MNRYIARACVSALTFALLVGCNKPAETPATGDPSSIQIQVEATPRQLVDTIIGMSRTPDQFSESIERHEHTRTLATMGPTTLSPLLEYMAAPDTDDTARLFILQCVNDVLTPNYLNDIVPMLKSDNQVIRAIGVTAIASIQDPSVLPLLREARNDPQPRVAFSALSGMAIQGDQAARDELKAMYTDNTTMGDIPELQIKREVVRAIVRDAQEGDLPLLTDALNQPWVEVNHRAAIVRALGRLGGPEEIPVLEQSLSLQIEDAYGKLVQQAIESIQQRQEQA